MSNAKTKTNRPTHRIYHVVGENKQARWTGIGAAWEHDDGDGFNVWLDYLPTGTSGRIVVRKAKDKAENASGEE